MIKLERPDPPPQLTKEEQKRLTELYKSDNTKNVWAQDYIREALGNMSHQKCAYCECKLGEECKYLEIDHFKPKYKHEDFVVQWDNLLPSCKRCNGKGAKATHDPDIEEIIDPTVDYPTKHLYFKEYRIYGKTEKGKTTVSVLNLNGDIKLSMARYKIGCALCNKLEDLCDEIEEKAEVFSHKFERKIVRTIRDLLEEAQPYSAYSATMATILLENEKFVSIMELMKKQDLWEELQALYEAAEKIKLDRE